MSGTWAVTGSDSDSRACAGCSFSAGSDSAWTGRQDTSFGSATQQTWVNGLPTFGSSDALPQALTAAAQDVETTLNGKYSTGLEKAWCYAWAYLAVASNTFQGGELVPRVEDVPSGVQNKLDSLGPLAPAAICEDPTLRAGIAQRVVTSDARRVRLFPPGYARNLNYQYTADNLSYTYHEYAEPRCLAEMKGRGAKDYCSMRAAAIASNGAVRSLGEQTIDRFLFWQMGDVSGNLRLLPPSKHIGTKANSFVMPFVIGAGVNPISGPLVPSFPELTHPVVWVTADSQHDSLESYGQIGWKWVGTFPNLTRQAVYGYRQGYRNTVYADYLAWREKSARIELNAFPFLRFWEVVELQASLGMHFDIGKQGPTDGLEEGWAATRAKTLDPSEAPYHAGDAQIARIFAPSQPNNPGQYVMHGPAGDYGWRVPESEQYATQVRYEQMDDRALTLRDQQSTTLGLHGAGGVDVGPFTVELSVNSTMTSTATQRTTFREELSMVNSGSTLPTSGASSAHELQTNAVVSVRQDSEVDAEPFSIKLLLSTEICIFDGCFAVDWEKTLFTTGTVDLPDENGRSSEPQKFRAGLFSQRGLTNFGKDGQRPSTYSHLPDKNLLRTFTAHSQTVSQCLASNPSVPQPPDPEMPTPGSEVDAGICLVFGLEGDPIDVTHIPELRIPANACSAVGRQAFLASFPRSAAEASCLGELLDLGCTGGQQVDWDGESVMSKEVTTPEAPILLGKIQECAKRRAETGTQSTRQALAEETAALFSFALCEDGIPVGDRHP